MRILVVGAGALGGYFGGRLASAGRDVTFLVRPGRARQLREHGLIIRSPQGDAEIRKPSLVIADELRDTFDLILLSCKAYDLESAMADFAPAVGPSTAILPLLNGMRHLEVLESRFGAKAVLGGLCLISAALDAEGRILHLADLHTITFGEWHAKRSARVEAISTVLGGAGFDANLTESIDQEMWEKWTFIAAMAGLTCLMRASLGDIVAAAGSELPVSMLSECVEIAKNAGFAPREAALARMTKILTTPGSPLTASMLKDIERGAHTEGEQILGNLLERRGPVSAPLLQLAHAHVNAYEMRRMRGADSTKAH